MKKLIVVFFVLLVLVGCWFLFRSDKIEEVQSPEIIEGISMVIKEGSLTNTGATVIITDRREDEEHTYGDSFRIEKNVDGEWESLKTVVDDYGFNSIGYSVDENRTLELKVNWEWLYGKLDKGKYRLIKDFAITKDGNYMGSKEIYVVFEIN